MFLVTTISDFTKSKYIKMCKSSVLKVHCVCFQHSKADENRNSFSLNDKAPALFTDLTSHLVLEFIGLCTVWRSLKPLESLQFAVSSRTRSLQGQGGAHSPYFKKQDHPLVVLLQVQSFADPPMNPPSPNLFSFFFFCCDFLTFSLCFVLRLQTLQLLYFMLQVLIVMLH